MGTPRAAASTRSRRYAGERSRTAGSGVSDAAAAFGGAESSAGAAGPSATGPGPPTSAQVTVVRAALGPGGAGTGGRIVHGHLLGSRSLWSGTAAGTSPARDDLCGSVESEFSVR